MKKNHNTIWLILVLILLGTIGYFLLEKNDTPQDLVISESEPVKLRIGYIPIADCAQLYVGKEQGYFAENGLEVELTKMTGGAKILEALAGGSIDIAFSNVVSVMLANNGGLDFIPITGGPRTNRDHKETGILVLKDSGIKSLKDLEGKKIAVNTRKNIVELFVLNYLEDSGVNTSTIEFVESSFPQMYQLLDSKNVDAVASIEPFVTFSMQTEKVNNLGDYFVSVMSSMEISTYNAEANWINKNKETVEKFRKSISQATDFANNNRSELEYIITKYTSLKPDQVKNIVLPFYGSDIDEKSFGEILNKTKSRGWINNELSMNDILN
ncbi:ABC transporter substrate-binding protein [Winogradskyella sp. 3972H.M.0a.05]|uniref:ABC transporter substrate-binding protein n=1 Tax=Winogradskyella sp. 3972H.M.0a.05 TaxID=2950277 RepID=UPI00339129B6